MADPLNPSFETAGAAAGQAANWNEAYSTGGDDTAIFDTGASGDRPMEDFETQHRLPESALATYNEDSISEFSPSDLSPALFDGADQQERFEGNYREPETAGTLYNQHYKTSFDATDLSTAMFDTGAEDREDFEEGHIAPAASGTQGYTHKYTDAPDANIPPPALATMGTAAFDSGVNDQETFEDATGWGSSDRMYALGTSVAMFDGATNAYDSYEGTWTSTMVD